VITMLIFAGVVLGTQQLVFFKTRNRVYRALWTLVAIPVGFLSVLLFMYWMSQGRSIRPAPFLAFGIVSVSLGALVRCARRAESESLSSEAEPGR
jgi:hypothetical protein